MKRSAYTFGLIFSALGFALSLVLFITAWSGFDPTPSAPWIWRLHIGALGAWGLLFLLPGMFNLRPENAAQAPDGNVETAPPPPPAIDEQARRWARWVVLGLLVVALSSFALVMRARTGVTATTESELATQYAISRLYALRMYAGAWLVLYGVPLVGFAVLRREQVIESPRRSDEGQPMP